MIKYYIKRSRSKNDPEKCLIPTIIYINTNHISFNDLRQKGFVLCIGWWDFSIKLGIIKY